MMSDYSDDHLDKMFYALSDRTRRKMLMELTSKNLNVSKLGEPFGMTKQAVSKHIKVLEDAGLIQKQKDGRIQRCQFNMENFSIVSNVIEEYRKFWNQQFDALEDYIEKIKEKEKEDDE